MNLSNESLIRMEQRSWYSVQTSTLITPNLVSLPKIYYQSLLSSQQDIMDLDQPRIIKDEKRLKTRKIRMYLALEEKKRLFHKRETILGEKDTKENTNRRRIDHRPFQYWREIGIEMEERLRFENHHVTKVPLVSNIVNITMNRLGHFYICVPVPLDVIDNQEDVKGKKDKSLSGVTETLTGFLNYQKKYDNLQSDKDQALGRSNKRKRYRLGIKMRRIVKKIRNLVDEFHWLAGYARVMRSHCYQNLNLQTWS
ncbi:hypothetical protein Glove_283g108 [Diversispora epigaea]|uniref:Uncharacterized protein n=1 Tax=Diversispora epigaea TaxID=1348612 RepID=A0A397I3D8_9GLOM|nr:hypothetical protein Glove_283g108 [Diversispora epigaea]